MKSTSYGLKTVILMVLLSLVLLDVSNSFTTTTTQHQNQQRSMSMMPLFAAKIPSSKADRDNQAIAAIKSAIKKPRFTEMKLVECEFPPLVQLNKLGDGSLRSAKEAENANIDFVAKLVQSLAQFSFMGMGPKINIMLSSSTSKSFYANLKSKVKGNVNIYSLKDKNDYNNENDIFIFVTPTSSNDYKMAQKLASSSSKNNVILINGFAKDTKSIPGTATMGYFLKPLTYNSQIAGYLIRSYPSDWTVLDAFTRQVLGTFTDNDILVSKTNTPDLRASGKLVQSAVDQRAILERQR